MFFKWVFLSLNLGFNFEPSQPVAFVNLSFSFSLVQFIKVNYLAHRQFSSWALHKIEQNTMDTIVFI